MTYRDKLVVAVFGYGVLLGVLGGYFSFLGKPGFGMLKALCGVIVGHFMFWPKFYPILVEFATCARFEDKYGAEDDDEDWDDSDDSKFRKQLKEMFKSRL